MATPVGNLLVKARVEAAELRRMYHPWVTLDDETQPGMAVVVSVEETIVEEEDR